jgi:hypothetical protein
MGWLVKRLLVVGIVLLVVLAVVYRQRLFVRDPLGKVERGGVRMENARVFINYSNDVLVEDASGERRYLVQHGGEPGTPKKLGCLRGMVCWTEADMASVLPLGGHGEVVMTNKEVSFVDNAGTGIRVELR